MKKLLLYAVVAVVTLFIGCTSSDDEVDVFGNIYGTITDSKTGEPVRNAEVMLSPGNKTAVSGSNGRFEFNTLEAGQYKLGVEADGYEYNSRQVTVVPGQNVSCDFRLVAIVVEQVLKVVPTTLNFGTNQNEMSVTITNEGTEETEWSVNLGNNNWLSTNPKSGRIAAGKSQTIVFTVNRELVTEDKSAVVNIAAFGNTYPINVTCTPKNSQGKLSVEPTSLDFGEDSSEETITIKNVGDASLKWSITNVAAPLSVSESEGEIVAGGNKVINVKLDRANMSEDINTSIVVSDGEHDKKVSVVAKKTKYAAKLELTSTEIDFGVEDTELPLTIKNSGNADLNWEIKDIKDGCISVASQTGTLTPDATFKVMVKLDRSKMSSSLNTSLTVTDGSNNIKVTIKAETRKAILGLDTNELDFGENETSLTFKVANMGEATANLRWMIDEDYLSCLTVSPTSGVLEPNHYTTVTVTLNREAMTSDIETQIDLYDLDDDEHYPIKVKAKYKNPANNISISNDLAQYFSISDVKCIGYKGTGIVTFSFVANGLQDREMYFGGLTAYNADGGKYTTGYIAHQNIFKNTPVKIAYNNPNTEFHGVSDDVKSFATLVVPCHPRGNSSDTSITFNDVPIEWVTNDNPGDEIGISNPFPQYVSISNVECIGYKGSGIVQLAFTATNITSSTIKMYFSGITAYSSSGDTFKGGYVANVELLPNTPTKIKYNSNYTQLEGVGDDVSKFVTVVIPCSHSGYGSRNMTLTNVPIKWQ